MSDCIFCQIIKGDLPCYKIYEDNEVLAFLDINPVNKGHVLVIPKEHYDSLLQTPTEQACKIMEVIQKIVPKIIQAVGSKDFNLHVNIGPQAGQVVWHTHFHIIPRFAADGHSMWKGQAYEDGQAEAIAEDIKKALVE